MAVLVKAPAKINLTLDVLKKRDDGYHEVEMIMTTIDLADRIYLTAVPEPGIHLRVTGGYVPQDENNLAYRAAKRFMEHFGIRRGVELMIQKNIPVAAGLAGGSSDAAATLKGLNRLWRMGMTLEDLLPVAEQIGSDVPFCLMGGTAKARGRGEKLYPLAPMPSAWVVLAKLPIGVSTSEIYNHLDLSRLGVRPDTEGMIKAIHSGDLQGINQRLCNVLESATFSLYPQVARLKEQFLKLGADYPLMTGSGPTIFALVNTDSRLNRLYNGLRGFCKQVYAVRTIGGEFFHA